MATKNRNLPKTYYFEKPYLPKTAIFLISLLFEACAGSGVKKPPCGGFARR
jgi:hypothetical protein